MKWSKLKATDYHEVEVSMSNLKAAIETYLRAMGEIPDSIGNVYIGLSLTNRSIEEWEKLKTVPIQWAGSREEVEVSRH